MLDQNYIVATGANETDVETAVMKLADLYVDTGFTDEIDLYKHSNRDLFLILFPKEPDFERFQYFVNYLKYPEGVKYNPEITGYWTITEVDKSPVAVDDRVMLYVSADDEEYDNVQLATQDGTTYLLGFGGAVIQLDENEREFKEEDFNLDDFTHIITIIPSREDKEAAHRVNLNKGCLLSWFM